MVLSKLPLASIESSGDQLRSTYFKHGKTISQLVSISGAGYCILISLIKGIFMSHKPNINGSSPIVLANQKNHNLDISKLN